MPQDVCAAKLGQSKSRLRVYTFDEIKAANADGKCILILDGAHLDTCVDAASATISQTNQAIPWSGDLGPRALSTAILHRLLIRINAHRHDSGRTDAVAAAAIRMRTPSFCTRCGRRSHDSDNGWTCGSGMILDVTRWLPEHPGGSSIIPSQALNLECSRFFEVPAACWACTACFRHLVEYLCTPDVHEHIITLTAACVAGVPRLQGELSVPEGAPNSAPNSVPPDTPGGFSPELPLLEGHMSC